MLIYDKHVKKWILICEHCHRESVYQKIQKAGPKPKYCKECHDLLYKEWHAQGQRIFQAKQRILREQKQLAIIEALRPK